MREKKESGKREEAEESQPRSVQVGRAHVLADRLLHRRLGEDRARGEGDIRGDRAIEGLPSERELLERGERDAADDRKERRVDLPLEDGAEDDVREDAREDGLGRLDGLREGDRAGAERDDGARVA